MTKTEKKYWRMPGKKKKFIGRDTLWAASDHLLFVDSSGFGETYRRFYYKDIKSLMVAKTKTGFYKALFVFVCGLVFSALSLYYALDDMHPAFIIFGIIGGIFWLYLLACLIGGPSCECWIVTAVQKEKLTPCQRLRPTLKMVDTIKEQIEKIQGKLDPDNLESLQPGGNLEPFTSSSVKPDAKPLQRVGKAWHTSLFAGLLVMAALIVWTLYYRPYPLFILRTLVFSAIGIFTIIALVRQTGSDFSSMLKNLTWACLGLVVLSFCLSYSKTMYVMFKNIEHIKPGMDQVALIRLTAQLDPFEYPFFLTVDCVRIAFFTLLGTWGLFSLQRQARS
jgi:hypothetical protein